MDKNSSIECVVDECKFHSNGENYCTLDKILVGKCEATATQSDNTDCESFKSQQDTY